MVRIDELLLHSCLNQAQHISPFFRSVDVGEEALGVGQVGEFGELTTLDCQACKERALLRGAPAFFGLLMIIDVWLQRHAILSRRIGVDEETYRRTATVVTEINNQSSGGCQPAFTHSRLTVTENTLLS